MLLPCTQIATERPRRAREFAENISQEFESELGDPRGIVVIDPLLPACRPGYANYQLMRNVLAAYASESSFCVIHDERRPDLREKWFQVMAAIRRAELRVRMKVLTWQELAALAPEPLRDFVDFSTASCRGGKIRSSKDTTR